MVKEAESQIAQYNDGHRVYSHKEVKALLKKQQALIFEKTLWKHIMITIPSESKDQAGSKLVSITNILTQEVKGVVMSQKLIEQMKQGETECLETYLSAKVNMSNNCNIYFQI